MVSDEAALIGAKVYLKTSASLGCSEHATGLCTGHRYEPRSATIVAHDPGRQIVDLEVDEDIYIDTARAGVLSDLPATYQLGARLVREPRCTVTLSENTCWLVEEDA